MNRATISLLAATVLVAGAAPALAQDAGNHPPAPAMAPQQVDVAPSRAPAAMPVRPYPVASPPYAWPAAPPYAVAPGALPPMPPVRYMHAGDEAWLAHCRQPHRKDKDRDACKAHPPHHAGGYRAAWGAYPYGYYGYGGYYVTVMVPVMVPAGYTYSAPIRHETKYVTEEEVTVPETKYVKTAPATKYVTSAPAPE